MTSALRIFARGSSRLSPKISAIGPRAQAITAGTSSATVIRAFGPSTASAARSVKPMPSPPISRCGALIASSLRQASVASASSDPERRLLINSFWPSFMENSTPRCIRRSSTSEPGTRVVSMCFHGIIRGFYAALAASCKARRRRPCYGPTGQVPGFWQGAGAARVVAGASLDVGPSVPLTMGETRQR